MITRLTIRDFQAHRVLQLKLDPGVTTIVGPTDVGKSAIIRALQWIALNEPRGADFIREGAEKASVFIKVDGHKLKRVRGKTGAYILNGTRLAAFGAKVPDEVQAVLNLGPINFQGQHEPTFWFTKSPGQVSRELNQIVDLGVIDETLGKLSSMQREARTEARVIDERLSAARKLRRTLKPAEKAARALAKLDTLEGKAKAEAERARTLQAMLSQAATLHETHGRLTSAVRQSDTVLQAGTAWRDAVATRRTLESLVAQGASVNVTRVPDPSTCQAQADLLTRAQDQVNHLAELIGTAKTARWALDKAGGQKAEAKADLSRRLHGTRCPLCSQMIDHLPEAEAW